MSFTVRKWPYSQEEGWLIDLRVRRPDGKSKRIRWKAKATTKTAAKEEALARDNYLIRNGVDTEEEEKQKKEQEENANKGTTTFKDFAEAYIEDRRKETQRIEKPLKQSYMRHLESVIKSSLIKNLNDKVLTDVTSTVIKSLSDQLATKLKQKSLNNALILLGQILTSAKEHGLISEVPKIKLASSDGSLEKIKADGVNCYTEEQADNLIEIAKGIHEDYYLMVLLGVDMGLRAGEILGLKPSEDIDWQKNEVTISRAGWAHKGTFHVGLPKHNKIRMIPMSDRLREALAPYARKTGYALTKADGMPLTHKTLHMRLRKAQKAAGLLETGRLHVLRHTFCSILANKGVPLTTIQAMAGHADIQITQRYTHSVASLEHQAIKHLGKSGAKVSSLALSN